MTGFPKSGHSYLYAWGTPDTAGNSTANNFPQEELSSACGWCPLVATYSTWQYNILIVMFDDVYSVSLRRSSSVLPITLHYGGVMC